MSLTRSPDVLITDPTGNIRLKIAATRMSIGDREAEGDAGVVISFRLQPAGKEKPKSSASTEKNTKRS